MIMPKRYRITILPVMVAVNAALFLWLLLTYADSSPPSDPAGIRSSEGGPPPEPEVLSANMVGRFHDGSVAALFRKPPNPASDSSTARTEAVEPDVLRLVAILKPEDPREAKIAIVEVGRNRRLIRLKEGLNGDRPDWRIRAIGPRRVDIESRTGPFTLTLD